jgi:hypothetical protein
MEVTPRNPLLIHISSHSPFLGLSPDGFLSPKLTLPRITLLGKALWSMSRLIATGYLASRKTHAAVLAWSSYATAVTLAKYA